MIQKRSLPDDLRMRNFDEDDELPTLQELLDLTHEQKLAWRRLERAVKDFQGAGGKFYCVLDSISGYNGEHVESISNDGKFATTDVTMPSIEAPGLTSFADDWHGIDLKAGVTLVEEDS
ncbi:Uncharacterised protein [Enterobacter cloacae]|nr:Uncharacterised protein [Enterobacter cloacae]